MPAYMSTNMTLLCINEAVFSSRGLCMAPAPPSSLWANFGPQSWAEPGSNIPWGLWSGHGQARRWVRVVAVSTDCFNFLLPVKMALQR